MTKEERIQARKRKKTREKVMRFYLRHKGDEKFRILLCKRQSEYRKRFPEKIKARSKIRVWVLAGKIKKGKCEVCRKKKVEAHHENYFKPLDVRWFCKLHHSQLEHLTR